MSNDSLVKWYEACTHKALNWPSNIWVLLNLMGWLSDWRMQDWMIQRHHLMIYGHKMIQDFNFKEHVWEWSLWKHYFWGFLHSIQATHFVFQATHVFAMYEIYRCLCFFFLHWEASLWSLVCHKDSFRVLCFKAPLTLFQITLRRVLMENPQCW